jgi:hypothetical protein
VYRVLCSVLLCVCPALLHFMQQRFFFVSSQKIFKLLHASSAACKSSLHGHKMKGACMTHYETLLANPAAIDARTREKTLANATKIAAQPRHPLYKKALALKAALDAAEAILPPAQDLVRAGALDWERNGTRETRFRGFANGILVAVVIREDAAKYRVEIGGALLAQSYRTITAARAAAAFAYLTSQPAQRAA